MKIALTIPQFKASVGGAEGFAVTVARELVAKGHELTVFAETADRSLGLPIVEVPLSQAAAALTSHQADVSIDWGLNVPTDIHRLGGGTHSEFMRYNRNWRRGPARFFKRLEYLMAAKHRRLVRAEARLLEPEQTWFIAVSEFVAAQLRRTRPAISEERIKVLHNGVDIDRFSPTHALALREKTRRTLGLADEAIVCLFVGHNLALKNLPLMMRVFQRLSKERPNLRLMVMGKRRPRRCPEWLLYAGQYADALAGYAAADILVHPTFYDACANVVLEGMACGLPIISSDMNGSAEIISCGSEGYVLPVLGRSDIENEWQRRILEFADDPDRRRFSGSAARCTAEKHSINWYVGELANYLETVAVLKRERH